MKPITKINRKKLLDTTPSIATDYEDTSNVKNRSVGLRKAEALELLNGTMIPSEFRYRQDELSRINNFLDRCLSKKIKGYKFLMLTGSPGAGKSLCANHLLSKLKHLVIKINANIVHTISEVQSFIADKLLRQQPEKPTAVQILRQLQKDQYKGTCIVYLQEIEVLFKTSPDAVSEDFLSLFSHKEFNLILIGISNTVHTLEKYSHKFSFSVKDIENIVFKPYTVDNIIGILQDKLNLIEQKTDIKIVFSQAILKYAANKLEKCKKGDFRIALEFLKDIVQYLFKATQNSLEEQLIIDIKMVNKIITKMEDNSKTNLLVCLPYQQQVVLLALWKIVKRTEALTLTYAEINKQLKWICGSLGLNYSRHILDDGVKQLQQYSFVQLKKKGIETKVMLNTNLNDIEMAYGENEIFKKIFQE